MITSNVALPQGDDKIIRVTVVDGQGQPKDLTGLQTARYHVAKSRNGPRRIEKSLGEGITVTHPTQGQMDIVIKAADTEMLKGAYSHELELVDFAGHTATVMGGTFTVVPTLIPNAGV